MQLVGYYAPQTEQLDSNIKNFGVTNGLSIQQICSKVSKNIIFLCFILQWL